MMVNKIAHLHKIEYMNFKSADSLKSEIRRLINHHVKHGHLLRNIMIDQQILQLKFFQNYEDKEE